MTYEYKTLKEITQLPKYKQLVKQQKETFKNPTTVNKNNLFPLYEWYINSCLNCKEFQEEFEKEYFCNFVNEKDLYIGDKNIVKYKL